MFCTISDCGNEERELFFLFTKKLSQALKNEKCVCGFCNFCFMPLFLLVTLPVCIDFLVLQTFKVQ